MLKKFRILYSKISGFFVVGRTRENVSVGTRDVGRAAVKTATYSLKIISLKIWYKNRG